MWLTLRHSVSTKSLQLARRATQLRSDLVGSAEHLVDFAARQVHTCSVTRARTGAKLVLSIQTEGEREWPVLYSRSPFPAVTSSQAPPQQQQASPSHLWRMLPSLRAANACERSAKR